MHRRVTSSKPPVHHGVRPSSVVSVLRRTEYGIENGMTPLPPRDRGMVAGRHATPSCHVARVALESSVVSSSPRDIQGQVISLALIAAQCPIPLTSLQLAGCQALRAHSHQ
mmetsp:Transcript_6553/g.13574  ORF Transcript_6553/g.13574 Transcript_6553/m.13574 type:complete len:111 (-) Transcript_6553:1943-2275(-)